MDGPKESCVRLGSRGAEGHCHGNQFWQAICYNWLCVNNRNEVIGYGGGLSGQPTKCNIVDNQQLMDAAMATIFWALDGL